MRITTYKTLLNEMDTLTLVKEKSVNYMVGDKYLNSAVKIVNMLNNVYELGNQSEEYMYMVCFNTKMKPIGVFEISHGSVHQCISNPREIFIKALMCNSSFIVLAHNHPSQDISPSKIDVCTYDKIKECSKLLGVELLDFITVTRDDYYSFAEKHCNGNK